MAIFKVSLVDGTRSMVVRAKCLTCARQIAVDNHGPEGTMVWRDPAQSKVELIRETDKPGLIMKATHHE